jgi:RNA polymerase sigma-70 factor (ECF subfamily)
MPLASYADGGFDDVVSRLDVAGLQQEIASALSELPQSQREALWLRIVDELDYAAIADATASSEQAVRLRVFRGLRALRLRLSPATSKEQC